MKEILTGEDANYLPVEVDGGGGREGEAGGGSDANSWHKKKRF